LFDLIELRRDVVGFGEKQEEAEKNENAIDCLEPGE